MKPAIFNTEMVRAILDGRKTQTRRACKVQPRHNDVYADQYNHNSMQYAYWALDNRLHDYLEKTPYKVGDIIYVRETFGSQLRTRYGGTGYFTVYKADYIEDIFHEGYPKDHDGAKVKWKPSIHMPKEYARLFLRVKDVRIERLNEISEEDAISEGIEEHYEREIVGMECYGGDPVEIYGEVRSFSAPKSKEVFEYADEAFASLWESIYGKDSFDNRYVWVIEFERISKEEAMS